MDEAVDEDKHPDGRAHVAHTSPHAQHSASMVVGLQSRAALALCDNDEGVQNLVELAEVEDPTPEGQPFVPQSSNVGRVRVAVRAHVDERVLGLPDVDGRVVGSSVTEPSRAVDLAHRVCDTCEAVGVVEARPGVSESSVHGDEGSEAVDREDNIVEDNEGLEEGLACNPPRLVVTLTVHGIEGEDGEDVSGSEEEWHLGAHREVEEPWRDAKRRAERALSDGRRQRARQVGRREGEELLGRQREVNLRARHCDGGREADALSMATGGVLVCVDLDGRNAWGIVGKDALGLGAWALWLFRFGDRDELELASPTLAVDATTEGVKCACRVRVTGCRRSNGPMQVKDDGQHQRVVGVAGKTDVLLM